MNIVSVSKSNVHEKTTYYSNMKHKFNDVHVFRMREENRSDSNHLVWLSLPGNVSPTQTQFET